MVKSVSKKIAIMAVMTTTMSLGKLSLSWLPNIEIVTLLIFVYTLTFGMRMTMVSVLAFVFLEGFLYGLFQPWWFSYLIHWPSVVLFVYLLARNKQGGDFYFAIFGAIITFLFGVQSTLLESWLLHVPFIARYITGIPFFITHVTGNFIIILVALPMLNKVMKQVVNKMSPN